jgi:hypothetical protein
VDSKELLHQHRPSAGRCMWLQALKASWAPVDKWQRGDKCKLTAQATNEEIARARAQSLFKTIEHHFNWNLRWLAAAGSHDTSGMLLTYAPQVCQLSLARTHSVLAMRSPA